MDGQSRIPAVLARRAFSPFGNLRGLGGHELLRAVVLSSLVWPFFGMSR
jgi:hypothetical protein